jgi:hypothetical protein
MLRRIGRLRRSRGKDIDAACGQLATKINASADKPAFAAAAEKTLMPRCGQLANKN